MTYAYTSPNVSCCEHLLQQLKHVVGRNLVIHQRQLRHNIALHVEVLLAGLPDLLYQLLLV
jgi:hypothetical protein